MSRTRHRAPAHSNDHQTCPVGRLPGRSASTHYRRWKKLPFSTRVSDFRHPAYRHNPVAGHQIHGVASAIDIGVNQIAGANGASQHIAKYNAHDGRFGKCWRRSSATQWSARCFSRRPADVIAKRPPDDPSPFLISASRDRHRSQQGFRREQTRLRWFLARTEGDTTGPGSPRTGSAQVGRTIAKSLGLNEVLTEAIGAWS